MIFAQRLRIPPHYQKHIVSGTQTGKKKKKEREERKEEREKRRRKTKIG